MSDFLKNVVKRAAGLPLSIEGFRPTSPAIHTRVRSGEPLNDISLEETNSLSPDTPQSVNTATSISTQEIQRAMDTNAASPKQELSTLIQASSRGPGSESLRNSTPLSQARPDSGTGPADWTLAQHPAVVSHDHGVNEGSEPAIQQTDAVLRETTQIESKVLPKTSTQREAHTPLRAQVSVKLTEENTPNTLAGPLADQGIRPARTERAISLQLPKNTSAPPHATSTLPIHVRIGRVEVRGNAAQEVPAQRAPKETTSLGFAGYQRMRRYRD